ncbi:MAG: cyclic nucleotide-binding domain-containing protein [Halioglobus sp.]|nr:cyclic nucleotide-binding domain-containing protein [Halioglobus sp.]
MGSSYELVIVGSGPAGLSAAARAQQRDREAGRDSPSYVLLESREQPSQTLYRFQRGKHVMAEPSYLKLRSDLPFAPGSREAILDNWNARIAELGINIQFNSEVVAITGAAGDFNVDLSNSTSLGAKAVVLAIGLQGNLRKLGVEGENNQWVQYQLDDPREYSGERILVVGAGDAAVENALGLSEQNEVTILNRREEFSRIKANNQELLLRYASDPAITLNCQYSSSVKEVVDTPDGDHRLRVTLNTPEGELDFAADRIVARLGALPPRRFLESCGLEFPNDSPEALPELSERYESNVGGLYVIGALAGYPLIKQAMNQGHDVVEFVHGNMIHPVDRELLEYQFAGLPYMMDVEEQAVRMMERVPMFRQLSKLAFRELVIESKLHVAYSDPESAAEARQTVAALQQRIAGEYTEGVRPSCTHVIEVDDLLYRAGDRGVSFFTVLDGEAKLDAEGPAGERTLRRGEFFGEMSLIAGQPRIEAARAGRSCVLMETPRRTILKLMNTYDAIRDGIVWIYTVRELQRHFVPSARIDQLREYADEVTHHAHAPGDVLWQEGEASRSVFIVRNGTVALSRAQEGGVSVVAQVRAGSVLGEMAVLGDSTREESAVASVYTETIEVPQHVFQKLIEFDREQLDRVRDLAASGLVSRASWEVRPESEGLLHFLLDEGLGEATNALFIDETLCVGCDNCEKACAETHDGIKRLSRDSGPSMNGVQVPVSCRHCEQPHCMKDCPPNAISRSSNGEVYIDDTCIGCGNCVVNCPYDAIHLAHPAQPTPGLFARLFLGRSGAAGQSPDKPPQARKCDACVDLPAGPACVRACPTGAAIRIGPDPVTAVIESL